VSGKSNQSILGIILTYLDTVSLFLARIILMFQYTKTIENLAQHCNIITWRWRHIWCHQKCHLQTNTDI